MGGPVKTAYLWLNGNVMAFDADGAQVPEYQGTWRDALPKLVRDFPAAEYLVGVWESWTKHYPFPQAEAMAGMLEGKW